MISNVGIVLWVAAATILLFTATVLEHRAAGRDLIRFVMAAGGISILLGFDDLFLFHENLAPRYLRVSELVVFLLYVVLVLTWLLYFRRLILRTHYPLLALSLGFFGASMAVDVMPVAWLLRWPSLILIEDGLKLLGIVTWLAYFVAVCMAAVEGKPDRHPA
jgi:hypothetical protein